MKGMVMHIDWLKSGDEDIPELSETMAQFTLEVNGICLTKNESIWSKTIKNDVLVSLYPLAMWCASSWWRLLYEPHPGNGVRPSVSWRMAHEMAAANHGFVWPTILFASDGKNIQVWSARSDLEVEQSVKYLNGSEFPASVPVDAFRSEIEALIEAVTGRLRDTGYPKSELEEYWSLVKEEEKDPSLARCRKLEAMMAYDPGECPRELLSVVMGLEDMVGAESLSELLPAVGISREVTEEQVAVVESFSEMKGLRGKPEFPDSVVGSECLDTSLAPWKLAVEDAKQVRSYLDAGWDPVDDKTIYGVLGISGKAAKEYQVENKSKVSIGIPEKNNRVRFLPRKRYPTSRRFEYARFLGDWFFQHKYGHGWFVSSELGTYRQKYQRAFAAEFLSPVEGLLGFLQDDYSESAIEEAAGFFNVSTTTVNALLVSNGVIENASLPSGGARWPYLLAG